MAQNQTYKTMQGKTIDLDLLRQRNELTPAVGNARVNARGDELGPGGQIIRKREEVVNEYYKNNKPMPDEVPVTQNKPLPDAPQASVPEPQPEVKTEPEPSPKTTTTTKSTRSKKTTTEDATWNEDEDGNFVKKEDT